MVLREDGEALKALGTISLREGREPSALAYFERAALANPKDEAASVALEQLRERMASKFRGGEGTAPPAPDDRSPPRRPR
jgi:hypothetical protein